MKTIKVILFFLITKVCFCQNLHLTEMLTYNTIRISTEIATGTGFFFNFKVKNDSLSKMHIPTIITNRHVINGANKIFLYFRKSINGQPENGSAFVVEIHNTVKNVIAHPNPKIDLVAIPIASIINQLAINGVVPFTVGFTEKEVPSDEFQKKEFKAFEEIYMIGYPRGLWDEINNMPIVREGITATSPYLDYNGSREFLIDIAAFGGFSGSPVFMYNNSGYSDKSGGINVGGSRLYLLGVLYSGPQYSINGTVTKSQPGSQADKTESQIPMNLGYVIKASEILAFEALLNGR
ncbi:S1 family peptidase [Flavobacterium sp. MMS24-S5]|uniref:S1 family peptidase n=1 Tax=Flavobacterium sp. MMS24-S5 TaxID=3416605 RepID=UPI003D026747